MKISLNQQIEEIERELGQRERVYPRLVATGKLKRTIAGYQVERMQAAKSTLEWLRDNEDKIKAALTKPAALLLCLFLSGCAHANCFGGG